MVGAERARERRLAGAAGWLAGAEERGNRAAPAGCRRPPRPLSPLVSRVARARIDIQSMTVTWCCDWNHQIPLRARPRFRDRLRHRHDGDPLALLPSYLVVVFITYCKSRSISTVMHNVFIKKKLE